MGNEPDVPRVNLSQSRLCCLLRSLCLTRTGGLEKARTIMEADPEQIHSFLSSSHTVASRLFQIFST